MKRYLAAAAALVALAPIGAYGAAKFYDATKPVVPPTVECVGEASSDEARRILLIGESWATHRPVLTAMHGSAVKRGGSEVYACALGFSGKTAPEIAKGLVPVDVTKHLNGAPHHVILLTGVNDMVINIPAEDYGAGIDAIIARFPKSKIQFVAPPIVNDDPPTGLASVMKRRIYGVLSNDDRQAYIDQLEALRPGSVIDYRVFSAGYYKEPHRYTDDGIHLADEEWENYGTFIGDNLAL